MNKMKLRLWQQQQPKKTVLYPHYVKIVRNLHGFWKESRNSLDVNLFDLNTDK